MVGPPRTLLAIADTSAPLLFLLKALPDLFKEEEPLLPELEFNNKPLLYPVKNKTYA